MTLLTRGNHRRGQICKLKKKIRNHLLNSHACKEITEYIAKIGMKPSKKTLESMSSWLVVQAIPIWTCSKNVLTL